MGATYNVALTTDRDWVRALIGDTDTTDYALDDATIDAVVAVEPNKYFAAAQCAEMILTRWRAGAKGALEKAVGSLRLRLAGEESDDVYTVYIRNLRIRGAYELSPTPYVFKVL